MAAPGFSFDNLKKLFKKYGGGIIIFFIATIPIIPFDVVGLFCGCVGYDYKKFFVALTFGKIARYMMFAVAGFYSITFVLDFFGFAS